MKGKRVIMLAMLVVIILLMCIAFFIKESNKCNPVVSYYQNHLEEKSKEKPFQFVKMQGFIFSLVRIVVIFIESLLVSFHLIDLIEEILDIENMMLFFR